MKYIIAILIAITAITGCEPSAPDELIDEETYKQMFMEFTIINQLDQQLLTDSSKDELRDKVYEHYNVTKEEFRISHQYYEMQIDEQLNRVEDIRQRLRTERDTLVVIERQYKEATTPEQIDSLRQRLLNNE